MHLFRNTSFCTRDINDSRGQPIKQLLRQDQRARRVALLCCILENIRILYTIEQKNRDGTYPRYFCEKSADITYTQSKIFDAPFDVCIYRCYTC